MESILNVDDKTYGGKAYGLSLLKRNGFNIPKTICIAPGEEIDIKKLSIFEENGYYHVAVRSSSIIEDSEAESKAGHFLTKIGIYTQEELKEAIHEVGLSGEQMGVIVQEAIDADYSGVIFSSNPLTYSKKTGIISYVAGSGEELVSGKSGKDLEITFDSYNGPFAEVAHDVKELENKLGYPVDVEWCQKDGVIWYLQCRPIAAITKIKSGYYKVNEGLSSLPIELISHDKIKLRFAAQRTNTFISDAYIHIENIAGKQRTTDEITQSKYCRGYSIVIIYPQRISEKVIRSFVGSEEKLSQSIGRCYRYGIRSYPEYHGLLECIQSFHEMASDYWVSAAIVQEIFDAAFTGIVQKVGEGYLIEITKGHFLTKGNVLTSQYYVEDGQVKTQNEVHQHEWFRIIQGHVIQCECFDENNSLVKISNENALDVIDSFSNIIGKGEHIVEFGMIRDKNDLLPYLIDFVDSEDDNIKLTDIQEGIISRGKRIGKLVRIETADDSLDKHFHDHYENIQQKSEDVIFLCSRPSISLLDVLNQYDNTRIAFAFEEGSILCHLAVVLRERGIPAVKIGDINSVKNGWYIIDAETDGLSREGRLIPYEYNGDL